MDRPGRSADSTPVTAIVASRGLTLLADRMASFVIPMLIYLETGNVSLSGLALAIEWAPRVISLPFTGVLVDALTVRRQLIGVDVIRALMILSLALYDSVPVLMVGGGLLSLCNGYAMLLGETTLARVVEPRAMPSAQARMQTAVQLSQTVAPVLGGAALALFGFGLSSVAICVLFLAGGGWISVLTARLPAVAVRGGRLATAALAGDLAAGLRAVFTRPALVRLILLTTFVNLIGGLALASLPALVTDEFGGTAATAGTVLGVASLASLGCAIMSTYLVRRVRLEVLAMMAGACLLGSAYAMAGAGGLTGFAAGFAVWSASVTVFMIWMRTRRLALLGGGAVGVALGVFIAAILAATPLSGVILAALGGQFSPQQLLFALTVMGMIGGATILTWEVRASRRPGQEVAQ